MERGDGGTVAATYVENRVTNHKRVYGGASDHWPQRIIDGYGRCRVSIRRTIEMKGCTRTVKADLVAIPRAERHGRDCYPPPPAGPHVVHPHGMRFDCQTLSDLPPLSVSNHLSPALSDSLVFRFFPPFSLRSSLQSIRDLWRNL